MRLRTLLRKGESDTVEFKQSFDREAVETIGAFANTRGGAVIIGVSDRGNICGAPLGKGAVNDWVNQISQATEPAVLPEVEIQKVAGASVVIIGVKEFPLKPVAVRGRYYKRVAKSNRTMTIDEIVDMRLHSRGASWDAFPAPEKSDGDLDITKVATYIQLANSSGRRRFGGTEEPLGVLDRLELTKDGNPTWASILMFGKEPQRPLLQSAVHCGRFKLDKTQILDDLMVETDLVRQVDEVMKFITRHISVGYEFEGKPRRKEVWEYPLEALREAVINAIVHRDYSTVANVQVEIYDDRIEIWNPGALLPGVTFAGLYKKDHKSVIRNKLVAQIFYDIAYIEKYGSGTTKMVELCKRHGIAPPNFGEVSGGFAVTFRKDLYTAEHLGKLGLNERQVKAAMYVKERGRITNKEYRELTFVSNKTAYLELSNAVEKGILAREGKGKGVRYVLKSAKKDQASGAGLFFFGL